MSVSPITDADSLGYHLSIPEFILKYKSIPNQTFNYQFYLIGIGEILNFICLIYDTNVMISFINFLALLLLISIINNIIGNDKKFYFFCILILSCPILIPLTNTAKPQLLFISLICFNFAILFKFYERFNKKLISKILFLISFFGATSYLAKMTFILPYFTSIIFFIYILLKKNFFYKNCLNLFLFFLSINFFIILPPILGKAFVYDYQFWKLILNPFPDIPGIDIFNNNIKNYLKDKNFLIYFLPLTLSDLTNTFGPVLIIILSTFFYKFHFKIEYILLSSFTLIMIYFFGQTTSRFYLDIYFILIILLSFSHHKFPKYFFIVGKYVAYLQSFFIIIFLIYGVISLFPANFSKNLKNIVFKKFANGYELYSWVNLHIPKNEKLVTNHRSIYFSNANPLFLEFSFFLNDDINKIINFQMNSLQLQDPKYILFWDDEVDNHNYGKIIFKDCLGNLIAKTDKVGFHAARNPFNISKSYYGAAIYKFKSDVDFMSCYKFKI